MFKMSGKKHLIKFIVLGLIFLNTALKAENQSDNEADRLDSKASEEKNKNKETDKTNGDVEGHNDQSTVLKKEHNNKIIDTKPPLKDNTKAKHINTMKDIVKGKPSITNAIEIDENKTEIINLKIRAMEDNVTKENNTKEINNTKEACVGAEEYCNLTREEYEEMLYNYIYPHSFEWALILTYAVVFVAGLFGNALVCMSVYRNHSLRTVTNYFIVNLAIADFMVLMFCLPPTLLWDVTETWFLGNAMCKLILYFQSVSVTVSVLTLTFISVDRWYAICYPLKFNSTTGRAKVAILIIWVVSLTLNAPELVVLETEQLVQLRFDLKYLVQCIATWSQQTDLIWHVVKVVFIYTGPLMLMTVAYYQIVKVLWRSQKIPGQADTAKLTPAERSRLHSRRKAAKMLAAVVIMFAICYFPVHLLSMLRYTVDMEQNDVLTCFALISHVLCYANSAINPIIYNFMSGKFRREFRRAFCCPEDAHDEHSTTLTSRRRCELAPVDTKRYRHGYVCQTTLF